MPQDFVGCDREQAFLLPPDVRDWLPEARFVERHPDALAELFGGVLEPMIDTAERELRAAGVDERAGIILADAGYWHLEQMQDIVARGTQVLVPPDSSGRKAPRPGWDGGAYAFMRSILATEHGGALYRQRQDMVEPVFADAKFNRRLDRFLRRGRAPHGPNRGSSRRPTTC